MLDVCDWLCGGNGRVAKGDNNCYCGLQTVVAIAARPLALSVAEVRCRSPRSPTSSRADLTSRVNITLEQPAIDNYMSIFGVTSSNDPYFQDLFVVTMCSKHKYCHQWPCVLYGQRPTKQNRSLLAMYDSNIWKAYKMQQRRAREVCGMNCVSSPSIAV
jgi:hypothetical protein